MDRNKKDAYGRSLTNFGDPINPRMGEGRWQDALRRVRLIVLDESQPLRAVDSRALGDKFTHCSWGMCSGDRAAWPNKDDHTFPADFEERHRVAPRGAPEDARCPMENAPPNGKGCFYRCSIFQGKSNPTPESLKNRPSRERAVELFDVEIRDREARYGHRTAADDDEPWLKAQDG